MKLYMVQDIFSSVAVTSKCLRLTRFFHHGYWSLDHESSRKWNCLTRPPLLFHVHLFRICGSSTSILYKGKFLISPSLCSTRTETRKCKNTCVCYDWPLIYNFHDFLPLHIIYTIHLSWVTLLFVKKQVGMP